ncbi:MAG TPA: aminotransferase class I/II-fold pyridoxal phosphate-dependent enzyme [Ferruginibacter sp.]|nr:threonine aldolase [Chitinophagaceae bacterium]HRI24968.1 aminotransferase class I/II-fold pyridoxal phosphate-dependent enzyme [Ferruginibacter sp.]
MADQNRRNFIKGSGMALLPAFIPAGSLRAAEKMERWGTGNEDPVNFFGDGIMYAPAAYLAELQKANSLHAIEQDRYGTGGAVAALEKKFEEITGKEKAIFMPSGTMANQFAIAALSGENTKVFVQDTSHVYRDEADAAQSVFKKRLMPLAKDKTWFTAEELKQAIDSLKEQEVFSSGIGAVSIENPVRRTDGRMIPIDEIKKISEYCRSNNIRLHLDGARIYMASAWSGVSVREYASYFDTIYISLYKYLGASGGAVLCGEKKLIETLPHMIKIHGGNMYGNWTNAAMALHRLDGFEDRMKETVKRATALFTALNQLDGIKVNVLDNGTNIYQLELGKNIDGKKFRDTLRDTHTIRMAMPNAKNQVMISVNETLLVRESAAIVDAFSNALRLAKN